MFILRWVVKVMVGLCKIGKRLILRVVVTGDEF